MADSAYRKNLDGYYTPFGFDSKRIYIDGNGASYLTTPCYYCGMPATTKDHTMPLVMLRQMLDAEIPGISHHYWIVPACHECNGTLATKRFANLGKRKLHVKQYLRTKYRKELSIPPWSFAELRRLKKTLRGKVMAGIALQKLIRERLSW